MNKGNGDLVDHGIIMASNPESSLARSSFVLLVYISTFYLVFMLGHKLSICFLCKLLSKQ
jgi:hypothetical protein